MWDWIVAGFGLWIGWNLGRITWPAVAFVISAAVVVVISPVVFLAYLGGWRWDESSRAAG